MSMHFVGAELMTGLPEYRNGGLFIDTGVLNLKAKEEKRGLEQFQANCERTGVVGMEVVPMFGAGDDVVVEWRAVTVGFLDLLLEKVNASLGLSGTERLSLPQMLEAGSWKVCFPPFFPDFIPYLKKTRESFTNKINRAAEKSPKSHAQTHSVHPSPYYPTAQSSEHFLFLVTGGNFLYSTLACTDGMAWHCMVKVAYGWHSIER